MQPWNFHQYSGVNWRDYYDPVSFYQWRRKANELHQSLFGYPVKDKFSVLLSTYNPERIEHLSLLIQHLLRSNYVHTVFITWHNPALEVPASLLEGVKDASRVKILPQEFDSLNNRFNPVAELQTEAVYILDDDIFVDLKDLAFTFKVWQSRKDSVVGHFPRYHSYDPETYKAVYKVPFRENKYSMVLTKSMFIHSDYLFAYTCVLDSALHHHVDNILNCEDISFSMMASGLSAAGPLAVLPNRPISDFGLKNGISTNSGHMPARSQCVSDLITHFWNKQDPLIYAQESVIPYRRPTLRRGSWSGIRSQLRSYRNN
ncbi:glycosyl transferase family 64 domain-containing protein [Radiomyces spectabilis]|uniref:glycosyl transferase family 64 domain-containing protein n=1 Tax=Radiomyces spectabilis TaxID=64574 RepID=UPI002220A9F8|nr:glycosyl transferase family 64 domain-containing protein [Radiomyces spectabilis]KAI8391814.1 glycosyl transferase family 64 domain-containing protein [Radiomyces spectabilis]